MATQSGKDERIEIRVSSMDKKLFQRAQKLNGDKSFSSFIVRVVKEKAEEIVAKNDRLITSENDRKVFFEAVFGDRQPNQKLVEAAKRYKSRTSGS